MTDRFIVPHSKLRLCLSSLHTQVHITPRLASPRIFSQPLFPFGDRFSVSSHNNSLRPEAIVYEVKTIQPSKKSVSFVLPLQPTNIHHQYYSFTCVKNPKWAIQSMFFVPGRATCATTLWAESASATTAVDHRYLFILDYFFSGPVMISLV